MIKLSPTFSVIVLPVDWTVTLEATVTFSPAPDES